MHLKRLQKEKKKKTAEATTELIGLVIQLQTTIDLIKRFPKKIKNIYGNRITDEISIEIYIYILPEKNIKISMKLD